MSCACVHDVRACARGAVNTGVANTTTLSRAMAGLQRSAQGRGSSEPVLGVASPEFRMSLYTAPGEPYFSMVLLFQAAELPPEVADLLLQRVNGTASPVQLRGGLALPGDV